MLKCSNYLNILFAEWLKVWISRCSSVLMLRCLKRLNVRNVWMFECLKYSDVKSLNAWLFETFECLIFWMFELMKCLNVWVSSCMYCICFNFIMFQCLMFSNLVVVHFWRSEWLKFCKCQDMKGMNVWKIERFDCFRCLNYWTCEMLEFSNVWNLWIFYCLNNSNGRIF